MDDRKQRITGMYFIVLKNIFFKCWHSNERQLLEQDERNETLLCFQYCFLQHQASIILSNVTWFMKLRSPIKHENYSFHIASTIDTKRGTFHSCLNTFHTHFVWLSSFQYFSLFLSFIVLLSSLFFPPFLFPLLLSLSVHFFLGFIILSCFLFSFSLFSFLLCWAFRQSILLSFTQWNRGTRKGLDNWCVPVLTFPDKKPV